MSRVRKEGEKKPTQQEEEVRDLFTSTASQLSLYRLWLDKGNSKRVFTLQLAPTFQNSEIQREFLSKRNI